MSLRITSQLGILRSNSHINRARERESDAIQKVASGLKINRASDAPADAARVSIGTNLLEAVEDRINRSYNIESQLSAYDSVLGSTQDILTRIYTLAVQFGNDSNSARDRSVGAEEIRILRGALLTTANAEDEGRYIFGGFQTQNPPFVDTPNPTPPPPSTVVYNGDQGIRYADLGNGATIPLNIPGDEVFTPAAGVNIFEALDDLIAALETDDGQGIRDQISNLQTGLDQVGDARMKMGARLASLSQLRERDEDERSRYQTALEGLSNVDLAQAATELQVAQLGVQAALASTARLNTVSLLDML